MSRILPLICSIALPTARIESSWRAPFSRALPECSDSSTAAEVSVLDRA